jgi:hypothetical protein
MVINSAGPATLDSIESQLRSGYAGGKWNGPGIGSSAAAQSEGRYGVGLSVSADGGQIEIEYALNGDTNLDGVVNGADLATLEENFGRRVNGWDLGDFNYDGVVDGSDFQLLAKNFGMQTDGTRVALPSSDWAALDAFAVGNGLTSDVPEPGYAIFAILSLFVARRRYPTTGCL